MRTVVRAHIDEKIKDEAAVVLATIGLTVSDAFRLMMIRTAAEGRLPFDPLVPSEETVEAMQAARRGELVTVGDVEGLLADLNADSGFQAERQTREEGSLRQDPRRRVPGHRDRTGDRPGARPTSS